jgi:hypothetical protein
LQITSRSSASYSANPDGSDRMASFSRRCACSAASRAATASLRVIARLSDSATWAKSRATIRRCTASIRRVNSGRVSTISSTLHTALTSLTKLRWVRATGSSGSASPIISDRLAGGWCERLGTSAIRKIIAVRLQTIWAP